MLTLKKSGIMAMTKIHDPFVSASCNRDIEAIASVSCRLGPCWMIKAREAFIKGNSYQRATRATECRGHSHGTWLHV